MSFFLNLTDRRSSRERPGKEYPKPTSTYKECMRVKEGKEVCLDRSKCKSMVSAYFSRKQA